MYFYCGNIGLQHHVSFLGIMLHFYFCIHNSLLNTKNLISISHLFFNFISQLLFHFHPWNLSIPKSFNLIIIFYILSYLTNNKLGFPDSLIGKESICNAGNLGSIPGLGRSPGEGKGYPLQYSGLENSMDCIVHGVTKSWNDWVTFISLHFTDTWTKMVLTQHHESFYIISYFFISRVAISIAKPLKLKTNKHTHTPPEYIISYLCLF